MPFATDVINATRNIVAVLIAGLNSSFLDLQDLLSEPAYAQNVIYVPRVLNLLANLAMRCEANWRYNDFANLNAIFRELNVFFKLLNQLPEAANPVIHVVLTTIRTELGKFQ